MYLKFALTLGIFTTIDKVQGMHVVCFLFLFLFWSSYTRIQAEFLKTLI